jgi:hypothetical protein
VVPSRRAPAARAAAWSRGRSPHRARSSRRIPRRPRSPLTARRQDAFALPECMSGPSVSRDGVGSLPTVVSCLTLVPKCCCWILARAYVSARVRRGWRRRTRRRCELQARTAMPGSECERPRCRARLNRNGREFEDFLVLQVGVGSVVSASLARQIENTVD